MGELGQSIVSDVKKEAWEEASFPILCETCLGDNPYVRMIRARADKECRICQRPCTAFRWQPGRKARFKQTIICQTCAKLKNVCQTCLFDLEFGLPVQVRDKFLEDHQKLQLPESRVNRDFMTSQFEGQAEQQRMALAKGAPHPTLQRLARSSPYYNRNRPRVCTFWQRGECTRGDACPYRHEEDEHDPSLADQNIKDRYLGRDDPVASKILGRHEERQAQREAASKEEESAAGNSNGEAPVGPPMPRGLPPLVGGGGMLPPVGMLSGGGMLPPVGSFMPPPGGVVGAGGGMAGAGVAGSLPPPPPPSE